MYKQMHDQCVNLVSFNKKYLSVLTLACSLGFTGCSGTETTVVPSTAPVSQAQAAIEQEINQLIAKMSLEEKVGQMRIFHAQLGISLDENDELVLSDTVKERLKHGIAGIKNPGEHLPADKAALLMEKLQKYIMQANPHGVPALFVTEAYNGVDAKGMTKFARPIAMAATWNVDLIEQAWDIVGSEGRARGLHMCHCPEADVIRDPRFGRMSEAFGEDTHLVKEMVVAAVRGLQGSNYGPTDSHIGAVSKHFAGYGQVDGGRNFASVQISERALIDQIFPPFKAAVQEAGTAGMMASHGDINGIASHGNRDLLTGVLREDWGFDGYTVSDSNDIARLNFFMGVAEDGDAAALMGLDAGVDIDLYSDIAYSQLPRLARENPDIIPMIDEAVRRVLRTKHRVGLFSNPYPNQTTAKRVIANQRSTDISYKTDLEAVILLKNDGLLPLASNQSRTIGLIGPLVNEQTQPAFGKTFGHKTKFIVEPGFDLTDGDKDIPRVLSADETKAGFNQAIAAAKKSDVVVLFLGGDEYTAKEAYFNNGTLGDRASIDLVGPQAQLLKAIKTLGKPVVVVLKHRRTLAIGDIVESADAILDAWDIGQHGEKALAELITGVQSPSGKLPVTVPRTIGQIPFHYSQNAINFKKGYLFEKEGPEFPFGFGLSYSSFELSKPELSQTTKTASDKVSVSVTLSNTGDRSAKEVVQLYVADKIGSVSRPIKELKAFKKVLLAKGESQTVSFEITNDMLAFTNKDMVTKPEAGEYVIEVGTHSANGNAVSLTFIE